MNASASSKAVLPLGVALGWRFFRGAGKTGLVSFISSVSLVGLTLAIAILVLVLSVMNGFEKEFRDKILGVVPHATIWFDSPVSDWRPILQQAAEQPGVIRVQPLVEFKAALLAKNRVHPVLVQGVEFDAFAPVLEPYLTNQHGDTKAGNSLLAEGQIIVGWKIARELSVTGGGRVALLRVDSGADKSNAGGSLVDSRRLALSRVGQKRLQVASLVVTGTELDNGLALLDIEQASEIAGLDGAIQGLQLQVSDIFQASFIAHRLANELGLQGRITNWTYSFGNLYTAIQLSRQLVALLIATIMAVAVFNIVVTLGMVVRHKRTEIAILRTMGLSRNGVLQAFVVQGMIIALFGCVSGLLLGTALATVAPQLVELIQQLSGVQFLDTDIYPIDYLPSEIRLPDLLLITSSALAMSLLATLVPAWRASKIMPAAALRYL